MERKEERKKGRKEERKKGRIRNVYMVWKRILAMVLSVCLIAGLTFQETVIAFAYIPELGSTNLGLSASDNINQTWKWSND